MDDEELVIKLEALIYERTQMTQMDAEDLAWDVLKLVKDNLN